MLAGQVDCDVRSPLHLQFRLPRHRRTIRIDSTPAEKRDCIGDNYDTERIRTSVPPATKNLSRTVPPSSLNGALRQRSSPNRGCSLLDATSISSPERVIAVPPALCQFKRCSASNFLDDEMPYHAAQGDSEPPFGQLLCDRTETAILNSILRQPGSCMPSFSVPKIDTGSSHQILWILSGLLQDSDHRWVRKM